MNLLDSIDGEIRAGLPNEARRLDRARYCWEFDQGDFSRFPYRQQDPAFGRSRFIRTVPILSRVADVLSQSLYREGPSRRVGAGEEADRLLGEIYRKNGVDAIWQAADRDSILGGAAAIQVEGTMDPDKPIRIHAWDSSQFCVWGDDPRSLDAVATIDVRDGQRTLTLWTAAEVRTYRTKKVMPLQTAGGTAYAPVSAEPNAYGVVPFAFAHFRRPTKDFWCGGLGDLLFNLNDYVNFRLTELGDNLRYYGRPIGVAEGVAAGWSPPTPLQPGQFLDLPADVNAAGIGAKPSLSYLESNLGIVASEWADLNNYIDLFLESCGIPPQTIRLVASRSGVSIIAEQAPLLDWAKRRQQPFGDYESDLARVTLKVAASWLPGFGGGDAAAIAAAARDPGLTLRWPNLYVDLPGPARDLADQWRLDHGLCSVIGLVMEREGLSRDEAIARLRQVADDQAELDKLGIKVTAATPPAPADPPPVPPPAAS